MRWIVQKKSQVYPNILLPVDPKSITRINLESRSRVWLSNWSFICFLHLNFFYYCLLVSAIVCLSVCSFDLPSPRCLSQTCLPVIVQCICLLFRSEISSDASSRHYFLLCILSGMTTSISPPPPGLRQGYHVPMATAAGPHDSAQCEWESCQRLGIWVWCRHCG